MDQRCVLASTKVLQLDLERVCGGPYLPENLARNLQKVDVTATLQNRARRRRVLAYMTTRSGFNTGTTYLQWYTQHTSTVTVQHIARRATPHPPTDRSDLTDRGRPVPHEQSRNRPNAHDRCRLSATRDGPDNLILHFFLHKTITNKEIQPSLLKMYVSQIVVCDSVRVAGLGGGELKNFKYEPLTSRTSSQGKNK